MALEACLELQRGAFELSVDVDIPEAGVTAVFGPSGSGKTTLLRCLAGLEPKVRGRIRFGDQVWQEEERRSFVPANRRGVGYVFQDSRLFSHLSVRGNLKYALRRAAEPRVTLVDAVEWMGIAPLLDRSTEDLSGGERQRVAVARTLLASPRLLLMDEPVSSLDQISRDEILPYIQALPNRLSIPIVYVSHSLREVLRLADHMIWMVDGRAKRVGTPEEVVRTEGFSRWQGEEAAVVVSAVVSAHDDAHHLTRLAGPWGPIYCRRYPGEKGEGVRLQIRALDVSLGLDSEPRSSILNEFAMEVVRVLEGGEGHEGEVLVELGQASTDSILLARITALSRDRLELRPGLPLFARVKSVAVID